MVAPEFLISAERSNFLSWRGSGHPARLTVEYLDFDLGKSEPPALGEFL